MIDWHAIAIVGIWFGVGMCGLRLKDGGAVVGIALFAALATMFVAQTIK